MNQGRIWTVVSPNHGLPLLIGSVALTSLIVHYTLLSHTSWFGAYWNGGFKKTAMSTDTTTVGQANAAAFTVSVSPVVGDAGKTSFVVSVTPKGADTVNAVTVGDASPPKAN